MRALPHPDETELHASQNRIDILAGYLTQSEDTKPAAIKTAGIFL